jgi:hypothetical protein
MRDATEHALGPLSQEGHQRGSESLGCRQGRRFLLGRQRRSGDCIPKRQNPDVDVVTIFVVSTTILPRAPSLHRSHRSMARFVRSTAEMEWNCRRSF